MKHIGTVTLIFGLLLGCSGMDKKLDVKTRTQFNLSKEESFSLLKGMSKSDSETSVHTKDLGDVTCKDEQCYFPIEGVAPLEVAGQTQGAARINGHVFLDRESLNTLVDLMNKSKVTGKSQLYVSQAGSIECQSEKCNLELRVKAGEDFTIKELLSESVDENIKL